MNSGGAHQWNPGQHPAPMQAWDEPRRQSSSETTQPQTPVKKQEAFKKPSVISKKQLGKTACMYG